MLGRLFARVIDAQAVWARPLGDFNHRWLAAVLKPLGPVKDLLHGRWLGHPLHSAVTDIPIGTLLVAVVLDLVDQRAAADVALVVTVAFMLLAALSGSADYVDTDGRARTTATVHATVMVAGLVLVLVSLVIRAGDPADRTVAVILSLGAFGAVNAGAYVGGDVVYQLGNMVSRHAFRARGTRWTALDAGGVDLATMPEAAPLKARAGTNDLAIVRIGPTIRAIHAVCAHAGGPLAEGRVVDGYLECPWHASRFRLADGHVQRGPAVYDQPAYEVRTTEAGGYEVRRIG